MRVTVQLDRRPVYSGAFPICRMRRKDIPDESPQKILAFTFRTRAGIFGSEFGPMGSQELEGNIWRAGGDPDAILLGVSFATPDRILLNSVHVGRPNQVSRSVLAKGLTISTWPVQGAQDSSTATEYSSRPARLRTR